MKRSLLVALLLLAPLVASAAIPTAAATPCTHGVADCINRILASLGCWDAGGDPFSDPFNWTPGQIFLCMLSEIGS